MERKLNFQKNDKNIISTAPSVIWSKIHKKDEYIKV